MKNTGIQRVEANVVNARERAAEPAPTFTPLVDIIETADEFVFQADLPGVRPGDVDVTFENGVLTLDARVQPRGPSNGGSYGWQEYGIGNFYRQFSIGTPVDADAIRAELKNGVLELHLPKAETAKTRRIEIQTT